MVPLSDDVTRVTIDTAFTPAQQQSIARAVGVWNQLSKSMLGRNFFSVDYGPVSATRPTHGTDCSFDDADRDSFQIIREDRDGTWSRLGLDDRNPAVTIRCHTTRSLVKQVVYFNTNHLKYARQFMSVAVHELGHAVGLDHSCKYGSTSSGYARCDRLNATHPYSMAVMFPVLKMGADPDSSASDLKEDLRKNDIERTECRYKGT